MIVVGEPITYVDTVLAKSTARSEMFRKGLVRSYVEEVLSYEVFLVACNGSPFMGPSEEGTRWIHGHHTEQSESGRSLLAAYALDRSVAA